MPERPGPEVQVDAPLHAATLRYFEPGGSFAAAVAGAAGTPPPAPLTATLLSADAPCGAGLVLAWLRPTETLVLGEEAAPLAALQAGLGEAAAGHVIDLTGGLRMVRLRGAGVAELLSRLGASRPVALGEARRARLADVPVLVVCVRPAETLLVVDRAYAEHLRGWIDATLADWKDE
jgi:heterotetrameric sarcosine oxidase gamma subunit